MKLFRFDHSTDWRLLLPLLVCAVLLQMVVPLARIATTYRALELALPLSLVGILSSAFALLPVLVAVMIGRRNDRRGEGSAAAGGGILVLISVLGLSISHSFVPLLVFTCLLGVGQVMMISALQMVTTRCSGPEGRDRILGNFLVAASLGHVLAPMMITISTPAGALYPSEALQYFLSGAAALLAIGGLVLRSRLPAHVAAIEEGETGIASIVRTPGLLLIVLASAFCVTATDLLLVFFPVLGAARGIDAATVGLLLGLRAALSMTSRLFFTRLVKKLGHARLLSASMIGSSLALVSLVADLPVWLFGLALAVAGFGIGLATACSMSLTLSLAPPSQRATAMSLRLTANRIGQFIIPFGAAATAALLGVGSIFALVGVVMLVNAGLVHFRVRKP